MSSDQRPGKVRVFSSGTMADPPRRRRGDVVEAELGAPQPSVGPAAQPDGVPRFALRAGMFLLGCVVGGALCALLGWMPGAVR